jgi:hypothetical protein
MEKLGQVSHGFFASSALNAITRLGIAEILHGQPLTIEELAKRTSTNADALGRALRLLCSLGIFEEVSPGKFANNDTSDLMRADAEGSQKEMLLFIADSLHFKAYTDMLPVIRDGKTAAHHVWGKEAFDVLADDQQAQTRFNNAMTNLSRRAVPAVLDAYDFSDIGKLVDVAGGHGKLLTGILQKYPAMRGVLFDLEHVIPGAMKCISDLKMSDRCEVVSGDFFKAVPSGDAIIMKHIIHDWDDERAIAILKNCLRSLNKTGVRKILLVEMLLSEMNEPHVSKFMDIEMLMLPGGRERTKQQFADLFDKAGLELKRVVPTKGPLVVLEAVPKS